MLDAVISNTALDVRTTSLGAEIVKLPWSQIQIGPYDLGQVPRDSVTQLCKGAQHAVGSGIVGTW